MWKKRLFLLFALSLYGVAPAAEAEQWYRVSESQLRSIEQSLENLETDRLNWESQAHGLRSEAEALNSQLAGERENYSALETSFNRYETSQSEALAGKETELRTERLKRKGTETQRNIAAGIAAVLLALYLVKLKFKVP
jgi:predicted  nucleic acid-binding Zn-ribbon protein